MTVPQLTGIVPAAKHPPASRGATRLQQDWSRFGRRAVCAGRAWMVMGALGLAGGCVNVAAPDKPIVIELNINIRQEVIYRLDAVAAKTIEENKDIF